MIQLLYATIVILVSTLGAGRHWFISNWSKYYYTGYNSVIMLVHVELNQESHACIKVQVWVQVLWDWSLEDNRVSYYGAATQDIWSG